MPSLPDVLGKNNPPPPFTIGRFTVADTSPFQVYVDGGTVAVDADALNGITYAVGDTGYYLLIQGLRPFCLPTA